MDRSRRFGFPRTDEERAARHNLLYPGEPLPPRGTGLSEEIINNAPKVINILLTGMITGLGIAAGFSIYRWAASKRKV